MKDSWIKVTDKLPELEPVSTAWLSSKECLCTDGAYVYIAYYQNNEGMSSWDGYSRYSNITHWQPIELPK